MSIKMSYKFFFTFPETRVILNLGRKVIISSKAQKTPGCDPGAFCN